MKARAIVLLTDFGTSDPYLGQIHGVLESTAPGIPRIDLTHGVPPGAIRSGAFVLAHCAAAFPRPAVFLAVVDPGVGTQRGLVIARADEAWWVAPDNGLLGFLPAEARWWGLPSPGRSVTRTFHGRDVLAPVAGALARGTSPARLGRPIDRPEAPTALPAGREMRRGGWEGEIVWIDRFGNLITDIPQKALAGSRRFRIAGVQGGFRPVSADVVATYEEGAPGHVLALGGSFGTVEISLRRASAALRLGARVGLRLVLDRSAGR